MNKAAPQIIFGTMRLNDYEFSINEWADFFIALYNNHIRQLHVSSEYETFQLFCSIIEAVHEKSPECKFSYMVKLADPHFSEDQFDQERFIEKINYYCEKLHTNSIDNIQWMWRQSLDNDEKRNQDFLAQIDEVKAAIFECKKRGLIKKVTCFPYTPKFAETALGCDGFDGLAVYLNPEELAYSDALEQWANAGKSSVAIRPFGGDKKLAGTHSAKSLLDFCFNHNGISGVVVTATKPAHLSQLYDFIG